jgi:hypothetical protein
MPSLIECWGVALRVQRFEPDVTPCEYRARRDEAPLTLDEIAVDASGNSASSTMCEPSVGDRDLRGPVGPFVMRTVGAARLRSGISS